MFCVESWNQAGCLMWDILREIKWYVTRVSGQPRDQFREDEHRRLVRVVGDVGRDEGPDILPEGGGGEFAGQVRLELGARYGQAAMGP